MYQRRTLQTLFMSMMLLASMAPNVQAAAGDTADCEGDPCAAVKCTLNEASAHGVGSEKGSASASVGGTSASASGPGTAHADAAGNGGGSAEASGEKAWSWKSREADCEVDGESVDAGEDFRGDGIVGCICYNLPGTSELVPFSPYELAASVSAAEAGIVCIADDSITQSVTFSGMLFYGEERAFLYDATTGLGIDASMLLFGQPVVFSGATLSSLAPVDLTGLVPTPLDYEVTLGLEEDGSTNCSAHLF